MSDENEKVLGADIETLCIEWQKEHQRLVEALKENHRLRSVVSLYEKYVTLLDALEEFETEHHDG